MMKMAEQLAGRNSKRKPRAPRVVMSLVALLAALWASGCASPQGKVDLIDLDFRGIEEDVPAIQSFPTAQAFWWADGDRVYVAYGFNKPSLANKLDRQAIDASLALDGLPAGAARQYEFDSRGMRLYHHDGPNHERYRSLRGVASVRREAGKLKVQMRVLALKEMFHILTGWNPTGEALVLADFEASEGKAPGTAMLARSEEDGMGRTEVAPQGPAIRRPGVGRPVRVR
jgi:hypothetical protein